MSYYIKIYILLYESRKWSLETGKTKCQTQPWLQFKASRTHMRSCLKKQAKQKITKE